MLKFRTENKAEAALAAPVVPPTATVVDLETVRQSIAELDVALRESNARIAQASARRDSLAVQIGESYKTGSVTVGERTKLIAEERALSAEIEQLQIAHGHLLQQQEPLRAELYRRGARAAQSQVAELEREWRATGARLTAAVEEVAAAWKEHEARFAQHRSLRASIAPAIRKDIPELTPGIVDLSPSVLVRCRELTRDVAELARWRASGRGVASQMRPTPKPKANPLSPAQKADREKRRVGGPLTSLWADGGGRR